MKRKKPYPFGAMEEMSIEAVLFSTFSLLFGLLAVFKGITDRIIEALQLEIFSLLFLQLYEHEMTKRMIRRVREDE